MTQRQFMSGLLAAGKTAVIAAVRLTAVARAVFSKLNALNSRGFFCRIEQFTGDGPAGRDQFFRVQMTGRIPTPEDDYPTNVAVEISDITDGSKSPEPVLSADPQFQSGKGAIFYLQTCNGSVPKRNAILARWVTVAQIPCHDLRFACRGRRQLMFSVSVLSAATGQMLTKAHRKLDYVNCTDGFRERLERKMEVLQSTLRLAALTALEDGQVPAAAGERMNQWLESKANTFPAASRLKETLAVIEKEVAEAQPVQAADRLLAWGEQTDKEAAIILSLETAACRSLISKQRFYGLIEIAKLLNIRKDFFFSQAQQIFLAADCAMEDPFALLGLDASMTSEQIIKGLTDEYRKWNARVTHPDAEIRQQTDRMLTLIADLRSRQFNSVS